jgi:hydrogenase maturation protease
MSGRVVIGIGHRDRGDDAFGRIVAARLRQHAPSDVKVLDHDGEAAALVDWLSQTNDAILVDAAVAGAAPGTLHRFDVAASALPCGTFGLSTHGMGLAEAIELARTFGTLPAGCVVYAVEACSFEYGAPLTADVAGAVEEVVRRILHELQARNPADA